MQWTKGAHAGFTTAKEPWMRVMDSYAEGINVEAQVGRLLSLLLSL